MVSKVFEIRDRATCIPVLATQLGSENDQESWLFWRAGFGSRSAKLYVVLMSLLDTTKCQHDTFAWDDRTYHIAHRYITMHFDALNSGDVVDVEFILGETTEPKKSERGAA